MEDDKYKINLIDPTVDCKIVYIDQPTVNGKPFQITLNVKEFERQHILTEFQRQRDGSYLVVDSPWYSRLRKRIKFIYYWEILKRIKLFIGKDPINLK